MKQTWTMEELELKEDLEMREDMLDSMRCVSQIKRPFRKLRYKWMYTRNLLCWMYWDWELNREWVNVAFTEEFQQAKQQKFENHIWICNSEKMLTEYVFRLEWFLGLWSPEKVNLELTSVKFDSEGWMEECLGKELSWYLDLDYDKNCSLIKEILNSVPCVFMKNVPIRKAEYIKQKFKELYKVTVTLLPKEENGLKQIWTAEEREQIECLELREAMLETKRERFKSSKKMFRKIRYSWECTSNLLHWMYWDMKLKKKWFYLNFTEEFQQAKLQKFEHYTWICNSERMLAEYVFRLEWLLGIWPPEKVDIELTSTFPLENSFMDKMELSFEIAELLELDYEKEEAVIEEILASVPCVFMKNVPIRKAEKVKQILESYCDTKVTLLPKEAHIL